MTSIAIIDYGMGNLRSVAKALEHIAPDADITVTDQADAIRAADRVIFPGVGALRDCMTQIRTLNLVDVIGEVAATKPFLGICLGMHALLHHSEENGGTPGLGLINGTVKLFSKTMRDAASGDSLKIPHMGWNHVQHTQNHPLWRDIADDARFYFVHSYYVALDNQAQCVGTTAYGQPFTSALAAGNIFAVQFHPEKSQRAGLTLLRNFIYWQGNDQ